MNQPKGIPFECPRRAPLNTWWAWVRMVRSGERPATRADFDAYWEATGGKMAGAHGECDKPRLVPCRHATPALMGQRAFNEMVRRIEAGLSDPRFRVVFGAIMWDAGKKATA